MEQNSKVCKRDPEYYFDDGSCIFLVENTLFKVHRTRLCNNSKHYNDSNSFCTMFSLPQGSLESEGQSDDNPIILTGNTPSEFRHFLWSLYALPPEIIKSNQDLTLMTDVARVANKYDFKDLETWALDTIHENVSRRLSLIFAADSPPHTYGFSPVGVTSHGTKSTDAAIRSTEELTKLIRLARLCNHEPLLTTMISHLKQLMSSSVQYSCLAMTLADELNIRTLKGLAYYQVMQKATIVKRTTTDIQLETMTMKLSSTAGYVVPFVPELPATTSIEGTVGQEGHLGISRAQRLCLLTGYYRLAGTWKRLRSMPPRFQHAPSCASWHHYGCTNSWVEFWREKTGNDAVRALDSADVVGRLKQVQKEYERHGSAPYMHPDCRHAAHQTILQVIRKIEDGLPDFFSEDDDEDDW